MNPLRLGPYHPDVAQSLNNLPNLYLAQARYADAELRFGLKRSDRRDG
jgi:hypothetical protein